MIRKAIILEHGGGELANQLWNFASIYAFALERGLSVENPSFFEYHSFFRFLPKESALTKLFSSLFKTANRRRRSHPIKRFGRLAYRAIANLKGAVHRPCLFSSENSISAVTYLPPTGKIPHELENCSEIYFKGWLFRNPRGLEKHRKDLVTLFRPNEEIETEVHEHIRGIRAHFAHVIGIHIRQGDYKTFKKGKYLIDQDRAREVIDEYVNEHGLAADKTCFIICSDGKINPDKFSGLNFRISNMPAMHDLFLLSSTDAIIGSDSSFGDFASWYGNIPHVVMTQEPIDWEYYRGRSEFFENRYSTLVHY